ncbi:MAG TPA: hypothetical protein VM055_00990 [Novosphingobium sp.]|nr:hypothetical protein [Novosphingobium sp.]
MQDTVSDTMVEPAGVEPAETPNEIPGHFWSVVAVSLLWNGYGAYDYTAYQLGMTPPIPGIDSAPVWATAAWALGVWGSFAGSVLLLMRSRHAVTAFVVSLVSAVVSFGWQFSAGIVPTPVLPAVILAAVAFFGWYAAKMRAADVLR